MTPAAGIPVQGILFTVFQSIFQVFLLCLAGFILSFKGIVDKPTSKVLNHINIALFTPALLFSKVAYFLTPAKLRQLWVIPVFFTVLTALSAVIAYWLARACRLKRSQVNFATVASMFMNSNSLPVALMQSLAATVPLLKWGPDDTVDAMFSRSLTYLVVFSTLGMMLRWSYGIRLIAQVDEPEPTPSSITYCDIDGRPELAHATVDPPTTGQLVDYESETEIEPIKRPLCSRHPCLRRHTQRRIHLHSHLPAVPTSLGDQSESDDSDELETTEADSEETIVLQSEPVDAEPQDSVSAPLPSPPSPESNAHPIPRWSQHTRPPLSKRILSVLTSLSPPLVASILALFCVLVPPVQRLLQSEEMTPFSGALDNAGACSIPVTLIVLGGWFWDGETKAKGKGRHTEVGDRSDGQDNPKSKGKGTGSLSSGNGAVPTPDGRQVITKDGQPRSGYYISGYSRDSSTASLSSVIGAVGDVFMARIHARGGPLRSKRHVRGVVETGERDVEPGLLATHAETDSERAENGLAGSFRSRSRVDSVNGRTWLSVPSSSPVSLPSPNSLDTRGLNPPGETLTVFVALLARMVIVPLVTTPLMVLISRLGWGGEIFEDPVFIVSSMLLIASPPALTLAQIGQRSKTTTGADTTTEVASPFERLLSRTVFWSYCVLTPPLMIASIMVGLLLIGV